MSAALSDCPLAPPRVRAQVVVRPVADPSRLRGIRWKPPSRRRRPCCTSSPSTDLRTDPSPAARSSRSASPSL